jgi:hypothetical protein
MVQLEVIYALAEFSSYLFKAVFQMLRVVGNIWLLEFTINVSWEKLWLSRFDVLILMRIFVKRLCVAIIYVNNSAENSDPAISFFECSREEKRSSFSHCHRKFETIFSTFVFLTLVLNLQVYNIGKMH